MDGLCLDSKRNQMGNALNPYQGKTVKILCVCSAGLLRSPTIAKHLTGKGFNTRACGTSLDYALIPISEALVHWADEIHVVKEQEHIIREIFELKGLSVMQKPIIVLDIPDDYGTFESELEDIIKGFYERYAEYS